MKTKTYKSPKVNVITLGCSKNTVDSENIITQLSAGGIDVEHESERKPDIAIINTCGFIDLAKEESVNTILEYAELKKEGDLDKLYVTGCLSERYRGELEAEIEEVDAFFGTMELPALLRKFNVDYKKELLGERRTSTPKHYAYMKISEGCNRTCSFCAIPLMRGKHVSKPIEDIITEAQNLAKNGVVEVMLIAQELTYYGLDIYKKRALPELLKELSKVDGIEWIRLHYAYPSKFPLEIIDVMRQEGSVCNYLDIPLQHAADRVLERMKRQITQSEMRELIKEIRHRNRNIAIRTTFLVGFPGESEEDFNELIDFVQEMRFDRLGVFTYSHEEDTTAHLLEDDIPDEVKKQRAQELMEIQRVISEEKNQDKVGTVMKVLIDRIEGDFFVGRTEYDSPEVDNEVLISIDNGYLRIGDFVDVEITEATEYDLTGKAISRS